MQNEGEPTSLASLLLPRPLRRLVEKDALVIAGQAAEARPEAVAPVAEEAVVPLETPVAKGVRRRTTLWWPSYNC